MLYRSIIIIGLFFVLPFCFGYSVFAQDKEQYPNISGKSLFELRYDRILSTNSSEVPHNDARLNIEPDFSLNLNKNWSVKTSWRIWPADNLERNSTNPERFRKIISSNRGFNFDDESFVIQQLKGQFQNEDLKFFFGKFNPTFGTAWHKEKRIGVFLTDFTKDYELREKIGLGGVAILENSELTINSFFNDVSGLSNSAINKRGKESKTDGLAGNTSDLSSYSVTLDGQDLFGIDDLFYNIGYRNLAVEKMPGRSNESGAVIGFEYLFPLSLNTSLIPFVEVAKFTNFSGETDRNAIYATMALITKYNNWTASIARVVRDFKQKNYLGNYQDYLMQYSVGYKFDNKIAIDFSRADLKEDREKAVIFGFNLSYVYPF